MGRIFTYKHYPKTSEMREKLRKVEAELKPKFPEVKVKEGIKSGKPAYRLEIRHRREEAPPYWVKDKRRWRG